ncbi:MAG TPA: fibro-slime domain-containing protein [Polyangiaceae bacterium]|nr:fibro-slime domain-containing protein [Polyangiaceae bacterium]
MHMLAAYFSPPLRLLSFVACATLAGASGCSCDGGNDSDDGSGGSDGAGNGLPTGTGTTGAFMTGSGGSQSGSGSGGGLCGTNLTGTIRDFQISHPDFEDFLGDDPGIVLPDLGADGKPVYAGQSGNPTTTGQADFDQWYRDVPGVNMSTPFTIALAPSGGTVFTYDNPAFFPIDDQLFGNEGNPHNFHFTFELHTKFFYSGGETFSVTGDDDLFTFINGKLAIDLGGVHGAESQSVDLDASAAALGITPGNIYALDFFFAERHTSESNFRIDTSLSFVDCGQPPR